ncbi:ent-kaurenoic acid oxidase 2 isoform X2 [Cryptomeria japonica]|uniref:ent-kaurenoic acid oxidase 2 isoform X2 n=1 Tax=Cryptomeria japonica TaxID=3369 RepID=UPI0027DA1567|nr:ent-kaurenoic acid oxidase 2 isoform X2 [Cryptomeria japonica]
MDAMWVLGLVLGLLPLLIWVLRSFNEWRFCHSHLRSNNGGKLPPGHMGWPLIGELLEFLWYFKFIDKPDEFIWKRNAKYGDTGIYRTYLFGFPSVITCSPEANRFVMGTGTEDGSFTAGWPAPKLLGEKSVIMVEGLHHKRLRRALMDAINRPRSLQHVFISLQPAFKEAFENWSAKGTINTGDEIRALGFSNICSLLLSFQRGPLLESMEMMYRGLLAGLRAQPINIPGTAFHYALKVIDEVIRLANVAHFMFRTVAKDTNFNGYKFPKGWKVIVWLRSIHVDPHYFKDPLKFNPDRWEGFVPSPGVYNVFGTGPRVCPGNNLVKMELFMLLHYICLDYKWELVNPNEAIKFLPNPRLADGAKLKFSRI